ncbi:hypothetical protein JW962_02945 [Candidatus Dojkabacteria bacterium]|nr:hypothetical protein [Candidatus Dojkabacteria bacterium]
MAKTLLKLWKFKWWPIVRTSLVFIGLLACIIFSDPLDKDNFAGKVVGVILLSILTTLSVDGSQKIYTAFSEIKKRILLEGEYEEFGYMTDTLEKDKKTGEIKNLKDYYSLKGKPQAYATIILSKEDQFQIKVRNSPENNEATFVWEGKAYFITDNMVDIGWRYTIYPEEHEAFFNSAGYKRAIINQTKDSIKIICFSTDNQYFKRAVFVKVKSLNPLSTLL